MLNRHEDIPLPNRAILTLSGPDRKHFLQGLITCNIEKISEDTALYTALLSPQGKYLYDFFISQRGERLFLDAEKATLSDLMRKLMMYKLRADVQITNHSDDYAVYARISPENTQAPIARANLINSYADPRTEKMGFRLIKNTPLETETPTQAPVVGSAYDILRLTLGLPDGSRDLDFDKTLILEANAEELNGVDFSKGCYIGQEVTARMKHRMTLKKRLLPVYITGPLPHRDSHITNDIGKKVGSLKSGYGTMAMGYFRLADIEFGTAYHCDAASVIPWKPEWCPDWHDTAESM